MKMRATDPWLIAIAIWLDVLRLHRAARVPMLFVNMLFAFRRQDVRPLFEANGLFILINF